MTRTLSGEETNRLLTAGELGPFDESDQMKRPEPGRCKTCKWWDGALSLCENEDKIGGDARHDDDSLWTPGADLPRAGPEFGCVHHHEAKETP